LSEGRRPPEEDRSGFGRSGPGGCEAADEFALMAGGYWGSGSSLTRAPPPSGASSLSKVTFHSSHHDKKIIPVHHHQYIHPLWIKPPRLVPLSRDLEFFLTWE